MSDDTSESDSPLSESRVVETRSDNGANPSPLFEEGGPIFVTIAIGVFGGGIAGYIVATINYAQTTGVELSALIDPSDLVGAALLLGLIGFWLGILVEKHSGGDQA